MEATYTCAERLAKGPSVAIRLTKQAVYQFLRSDSLSSLEAVTGFMGVAASTEDHLPPQPGAKSVCRNLKGFRDEAGSSAMAMPGTQHMVTGTRYAVAWLAPRFHVTLPVAQIATNIQT